MVVLVGGLQGEKGAVALTAKEDIMRVLARKMKKCLMYIILSILSPFILGWWCNLTRLSYSGG